jgi:hypothetical protein
MELQHVRTTAETEPVPDGLRWLKLLGPEYERLADQPSGYEIAGQPVLIRDFDQLCGEHARPLFTGLESIGADDPQFPAYQEVARQLFDHHFRQEG